MKQRSASDIREMLSILRDFKVPEEDLKQAAINAAKEFGLSLEGPRVKYESVAEFIDAWRAQEISLPLIACRSSDLHAAYLVWMEITGQSNPATQAAFGRDLNRLNLPRIHTRTGHIIDASGAVSGVLEQEADKFKAALEGYRALNGVKA